MQLLLPEANTSRAGLKFSSLEVGAMDVIYS